jgi:hypothetical protein
VLTTDQVSENLFAAYLDRLTEHVIKGEYAGHLQVRIETYIFIGCTGVRAFCDRMDGCTILLVSVHSSGERNLADVLLGWVISSPQTLVLAVSNMCSISLSEYFSPITRRTKLMAVLGVALNFSQVWISFIVAWSMVQ